jgi:hypothetical protein
MAQIAAVLLRLGLSVGGLGRNVLDLARGGGSGHGNGHAFGPIVAVGKLQLAIYGQVNGCCTLDIGPSGPWCHYIWAWPLHLTSL